MVLEVSAWNASAGTGGGAMLFVTILELVVFGSFEPAFNSAPVLVGGADVHDTL